MISLNRINDNLIQIYGSYEKIRLRGLAKKVKINSNYKAWQYNITLLCPPKHIILKSNITEATLNTEEKILTRIITECEKILKL